MRPRQQQQYRDQRDKLLLHVLQRAARREGERDHGNHQHLPVLQRRRTRALTPRRSAPRLVDHGKGAAYQEDEEDDGGRLRQSPLGWRRTPATAPTVVAGTVW